MTYFPELETKGLLLTLELMERENPDLAKVKRSHIFRIIHYLNSFRLDDTLRTLKRDAGLTDVELKNVAEDLKRLSQSYKPKYDPDLPLIIIQ